MEEGKIEEVRALKFMKSMWVMKTRRVVFFAQGNITNPNNFAKKKW
jgi:hypothetical protein